VGTRYHCAVVKIDVCQSCEPTFEHRYPLLKYKRPIENYDPVTVVPEQLKQIPVDDEVKLMNYYDKVYEYDFNSEVEKFMLEMGSQGFTSFDLNLRYLNECNSDFNECRKKLKNAKGVK
jgi:hypothetical protein